jgi:multifunctional 2-oxoglutarate metabolism enzyme
MALNLPAITGRPLILNSREASSAPAVGSHQRHEIEQRALVESAFA